MHRFPHRCHECFTRTEVGALLVTSVSTDLLSTEKKYSRDRMKLEWKNEFKKLKFTSIWTYSKLKGFCCPQNLILINMRKLFIFPCKAKYRLANNGKQYYAVGQESEQIYKNM